MIPNWVHATRYNEARLGVLCTALADLFTLSRISMHLLWLLFAFILVLLNAFFVAAEFGMVKLRHTRVQLLQETQGLRGRVLAKVHKNLDAYLSACQLGITLASLGLGWVGEPALFPLIHPLFAWLPASSPELTKVFSFFFTFLLLSFLHIVMGELMPKTWAIRQAEHISLWTAIPLFAFYWCMYPAIWLLNNCSGWLLKTIGLGTLPQADSFYSTKEIKLILGASQSYGELTQAETEIIEQTLDFADLEVTEVMRPYAEMVTLNMQQSTAELLSAICAHRYSRYPLYDTQQHAIVGILHVKDVFSALYQDPSTQHADKPLDISALARPILKVPAHLPALDLLDQFRKGTSHFALVYHGVQHDIPLPLEETGFAPSSPPHTSRDFLRDHALTETSTSKEERYIGFITWDNLLQVLLGHVKDEFHKTQDSWTLHADGTLRVRGDCTIYALEKALQQDILPESEEANTLAGLILNQVGFMPQEGEHVQFAAFEAVIEKIRGSRLQWVKVIPKRPG
jgi:CBS domain containing-hemolysin-like protein